MRALASDQPRGSFGLFAGIRGDGRDAVADEPHAIAREDRIVLEAATKARLLRQVRARDDRLDTRAVHRLRGVHFA